MLLETWIHVMSQYEVIYKEQDLCVLGHICMVSILMQCSGSHKSQLYEYLRSIITFTAETYK